MDDLPRPAIEECTVSRGMICTQCHHLLPEHCYAVRYRGPLAPVCSEACAKALIEDFLKFEAKVYGPSRPGDFMGIDYWLKKDEPRQTCSEYKPVTKEEMTAKITAIGTRDWSLSGLKAMRDKLNELIYDKEHGK